MAGLDSRAVAGILGVLSLVYWWLRPKPFSDIPHNPVNSVLGDIPELKRFIEGGNKRPLDYFAHLAERHGPITQVCLGRKVMVLLSDREEAERILVRGKNVDTLVDFRKAFSSIIPTGQISLPTSASHNIVFVGLVTYSAIPTVLSLQTICGNDTVDLWALPCIAVTSRE
ncbi:hypothetical protein FRC08_015652 [Ceratobasidium sp. 394]|nr:hypothetical protein FRC08_015652 [Ceratobasidium sp. 394]